MCYTAVLRRFPVSRYSWSLHESCAIGTGISRIRPPRSQVTNKDTFMDDIQWQLEQCSMRNYASAELSSWFGCRRLPPVLFMDTCFAHHELQLLTAIFQSPGNSSKCTPACGYITLPEVTVISCYPRTECLFLSPSSTPRAIYSFRTQSSRDCFRWRMLLQYKTVLPNF